MGNVVKINKQAFAKMQRELQRELDKHPIHVPITADSQDAIPATSPTTVNHYHSPVVTVTGDYAQVSWGDGTIRQEQQHTSQVAPGFEPLAQTVSDILAKLGAFSLPDEEVQEARKQGEILLAEVSKPSPDEKQLKRASTALKGLLASAAAGVGQAVTAETSTFARHAISAISAFFAA